MKRFITLTVLLLTLVLVACTQPVKSNARAYVTSVVANTQDASFRVEVRDPDNELEHRTFVIKIESASHGLEEVIEIPKNGVRTINFENLNRETTYAVRVLGRKAGADLELYYKSDAVKTVKQGDVEKDPLMISTKEEFLNMDSKKHYKLTADLDFQDESFAPLFSSGAPFNGSFDGDNHTIKNINLVAESDVYKSYLSIFGYASKSTIKNIKFDNITIDNASKPYIGIHYVGIVVSKISNNEFLLDNIEITNSDVTIKHNLNQSATNRNLYIGLLGGSLQGTISNITIKDSTLNVIQNGVNGTYSGADAATTGTYIGGVVGLIEQDKGINISNIAFMDSEVNVEINQDKKSLGTGQIYIGSIFGSYRSDKNVSNLVSNGQIHVTHTKHQDTEDTKLDMLYVGGLVGSMTKASLQEAYFFGEVVATLSHPLNRVYTGLVAAQATKSGVRILGGGSILVQSSTGTQIVPTSEVYPYTWREKSSEVKVLSTSTITIDGQLADLSGFGVETPDTFLTSDFIKNLLAA